MDATTRTARRAEQIAHREHIKQVKVVTGHRNVKLERLHRSDEYALSIVMDLAYSLHIKSLSENGPADIQLQAHDTHGWRMCGPDMPSLAGLKFVSIAHARTFAEYLQAKPTSYKLQRKVRVGQINGLGPVVEDQTIEEVPA